MPAIKHLFHIAVPREKVYEAINTIDGNDMKVTAMKKNEILNWECAAGPDGPVAIGWMGTIVQFQLDENDNKQGSVLNMLIGKKPMIFMLDVLLPGEDIWRASGSCVKPVKGKLLSQKDTGYKN